MLYRGFREKCCNFALGIWVMGVRCWGMAVTLSNQRPRAEILICIFHFTFHLSNSVASPLQIRCKSHSNPIQIPFKSHSNPIQIPSLYGRFKGDAARKSRSDEHHEETERAYPMAIRISSLLNGIVEGQVSNAVA